MLLSRLQVPIFTLSYQHRLTAKTLILPVQLLYHWIMQLYKSSGTISNLGTFNTSNGTIELNGSTPQVIPANVFADNTIKNLVISNNVSLQGQDTLTGTLTMTGSGKTFATNNFLTLKSTASGTASVAPIPVDAFGVALNFITGNVIVERYIPGHRAWRLLTTPVVNTQTINQAWQEGVVNHNINLSGRK